MFEITRTDNPVYLACKTLAPQKFEQIGCIANKIHMFYLIEPLRGRSINLGFLQAADGSFLFPGEADFDFDPISPGFSENECSAPGRRRFPGIRLALAPCHGVD